MKPGYIILNLWEKRWTKLGYRKLGTHSKSQSNATPRGRYFKQYFFFVKAIVLQKCKAGKSIMGEYNRECVLLELNNYCKKSSTTSGVLGTKLLFDNTPARKSKLVQEYLYKKNRQTLPHFSCSPDLAPCDFLLLLFVCFIFCFLLLFVFRFKEKPLRTQIHFPFRPWIYCFSVFGPPPRRKL